MKSQPDYGYLSSSQMRDLRKSRLAGKTVRQLAIKYGITETTVRRVLDRVPQ